MELTGSALSYLLDFLCGRAMPDSGEKPGSDFSVRRGAGSTLRSSEISSDAKGADSMDYREYPYRVSDGQRERLRIGYVADKDEWEHYDIVFVPSGFFDSEDYASEASLPAGPLPRIEGVPFLYGEARLERLGGCLAVYADLPASAFVLLSRYEEICRPSVRDGHGRFPGKESLLYRNGLIERALVDEYRDLVWKWAAGLGFRLPEYRPGFGKIWLTHDIDAPFYCRGLRAFARESLKGKGVGVALRWACGPKEKDPYYTFDFFCRTDNAVARSASCPVQAVYFLKAGGTASQDRPFYNLKSRDMQGLISFLRAQGAVFGLHGSYSSGKDGKGCVQEKAMIEDALQEKTFRFRQHFLRSCEPSAFACLEENGLWEDFTMGYADVAGFRLGTSRAVRWINPYTGELSELILHPLLVMDNTLYQYMEMGYEESQACCERLLGEAYRHGGDACLLWHNSSVAEGPYPAAPVDWIRKLYADLCRELKSWQNK